MKLIKQISVILTFVIVGGLCQAQGMFGWNNPNTLFSISTDQGWTALTANTDATISWTVNTLSSPSGLDFSYSVNDSQQISLGEVNGVGQSFSVSASQGDVLKFYYEGATSVFSTALWNSDYMTSTYSHNGVVAPYYWTMSVVAGATEGKSPSGQPLPGILLTLAFAGGIIGLSIRKTSKVAI